MKRIKLAIQKDLVDKDITWYNFSRPRTPYSFQDFAPITFLLANSEGKSRFFWSIYFYDSYSYCEGGLVLDNPKLISL